MSIQTVRRASRRTSPIDPAKFGAAIYELGMLVTLRHADQSLSKIVYTGRDQATMFGYLAYRLQLHPADRIVSIEMLEQVRACAAPQVGAHGVITWPLPAA